MTVGDIIDILNGYDRDTQVEVTVGSFSMPLNYEITDETGDERKVIIHAYAGTAETKARHRFRSDFPSTMIEE